MANFGVKQFGWMLLWLATLAGCGTDHGTIPVHGIVTLDGSPPPGPGKVMFTQIEGAPGVPHRPGFALFDASGRFQAQTFKPGDGLFAGKYGVAVECWEVAPNMEGKAVKSFIPDRYLNPSHSGFELTLSPGASATTFDIPLKSGP